MPHFGNYTDCIHCEDRELIEEQITQILELEGCRRILNPPPPISIEEIYHNSWRLLRDLWIIGIFVGAPEWTIVKTRPNELLCRRALDSTRPRLSELAMRIGCDCFHLGAYDNYGILLEVDAQGNLYVSGDVDRLGEEENWFYQEPINFRGESMRFSLIDVPQAFQTIIQFPNQQQLEEEEKRIEQLKIIIEELKQPLREEEHEEINLDFTDDPWNELLELAKGYSHKVDQALRKFLQGEPSYWYLRDNLFYLAYTQQEHLEADGARLLFFQPAEHYRQLHPLYEIEAQY